MQHLSSYTGKKTNLCRNKLNNWKEKIDAYNSPNYFQTFVLFIFFKGTSYRASPVIFPAHSVLMPYFSLTDSRLNLASVHLLPHHTHTTFMQSSVPCWAKKKKKNLKIVNAVSSLKRNQGKVNVGKSTCRQK